MPEAIVHHLGFLKRSFTWPLYVLLKLWYSTLHVRMDVMTRAVLSEMPQLVVFE